MNAYSFVEDTTAALQTFLSEALANNPALPGVDLRLGLPEASKLEGLRSKPSMLERLGGTPAIPAYLVTYHVARVNSNRTTNRVARDVDENGVRKATFAREPEAYRLKYFILGPALAEASGQRLLAGFVSLFFDQSQIEVTSEGETEVVRLHEPAEQSDEIAQALLKQSGIPLSPLYFFQAEVKVATGTQLAKDTLVRTRQISIDRRRRM